MKKAISILLLCMATNFLHSCGSTYSLYHTPINNVKKSISSGDSFQTSTINYANIEDKFGYEDELVTFAFIYAEKTILFKICNKSQQTAKIDWNEIVYIAPNNSSCRVIHKGVRYMDKDSYQTPTYIGANSELLDQLLPVSQIYYLDPEFSGIWMFAGKSGGWNVNPIFPKYDSQKEADASPLINRSVRLIFPVYIGDIKHEYEFEFKIDKIVVSKKD